MVNKIELWYKEVLPITKEFSIDEMNFIIYKGFKICKKENGSYTLQDVRYDDYYSDVSKVELNLMVEKGFVKAVDEINNTLNIQRIKDYTKRIEFLYAKRKKAKLNMDKDVRLNKKRIKLANRNIDILVDQMFLYKTRIKQFNNKYN